MRGLEFLLFLALALSGSAAPLGLQVPAYFYPGSLWNSMNWAAPRVPLVAIMNPNSGPDTFAKCGLRRGGEALNPPPSRTPKWRSRDRLPWR